MGSGRRLSEEEKTKIVVYRDEGYSNRQIGLKIGRSAKVVNNFVKNGHNYGKYSNTGKKKNLTNRDIRSIYRNALVKHQTASQIRANLQLSVTTRRVQQVLKANPNVHWRKRLSKPKLTEKHRKERLLFARKYMSWTDKWHNVLFSDEKKFNLDGPDGFQYYWHDLRNKEEVCMSRSFGGGTVMVWGGFGYNGQLPIAWISTKMKSKDYTDLLETSLIDHGEALMGSDFVFQHDNAPIHQSRETKNWLAERNIDVLAWPPYSPDLNPIENLWGIIANEVYKNGKQFDNIIDLKKRITDVWNGISLYILCKLVRSMPDRLYEVIKNNGGSTKY